MGKYYDKYSLIQDEYKQPDKENNDGSEEDEEDMTDDSVVDEEIINMVDLSDVSENEEEDES